MKFHKNPNLSSLYVLLTTCLLSFIFSACSEHKSENSVAQQKKIPIIFDTDFGGDADDLGALAMLNHFKNRGEIDLLSVMCWNTEKYAVSAIDAVNTYYGNPNIPIGLRAGESHETPWNHSKIITENLSFDALQSNVPKSTDLYRKILSASADKSIIIVTVGPLMNIQNLIDSSADEYSDLTGKELITQKVKEFVIMGGHFPKGENEWNFDGDMPGVTSYVLENLDSPITFTGFEVGAAIKTGEVFNDLDKSSPLYLGFKYFSEHAPWTKEQYAGKIHDNATFDQTAVLYAARGELGNYWHKVEGGYCKADSTGGNIWVEQQDSKHSYLVLDKSGEAVAAKIEAFMLGEF